MFFILDISTRSAFRLQVPLITTPWVPVPNFSDLHNQPFISTSRSISKPIECATTVLQFLPKKKCACTTISPSLPQPTCLSSSPSIPVAQHGKGKVEGETVGVGRRKKRRKKRKDSPRNVSIHIDTTPQAPLFNNRRTYGIAHRNNTLCVLVAPGSFEEVLYFVEKRQFPLTPVSHDLPAAFAESKTAQHIELRGMKEGGRPPLGWTTP